MSKHTKGKWVITKDDEYNRYCIDDVTGTQCEPIAEISFRNAAHPNTERNLLLICEAPELLEALKIISGWSRCQCVGTHGTNLNCCVLIADNAIAKAEGK